jgi:hypothetical protein
MPQIKRLTRNQQTTMRIKKNLILDRNYLADAEIKEGQMGYLVLCTSELERFFNAPRSARHGEAFTLTASDKPFLGSKSVEVHIFDLENKDITRASWIDPEYPECPYGPYGGTLMHGAEDILIQIFGKVGRHTVYFRVTPKKTEK